MTDWLSVSSTERKLLYEFVKRAGDEAGLPWDVLLLEALGALTFDVDSYVNNFRAGRNSRAHCVRIFAWLRDRRPELASALVETIKKISIAHIPMTIWERFVGARGQYGKVSVIKGPIIESARRQLRQEHHQIQIGSPPPPMPRVDFRQSFIFELESEASGYLIALQWIAGFWRTLPLTKSEFGIAIEKGPQRLPPAGDKAKGIDVASADTYREENEGGLHRIVFLVLPAELGIAISTELARWWRLSDAQLETVANATLGLEPASWCLLRADILFPSEPVDSTGRPFDDEPHAYEQPQ